MRTHFHNSGPVHAVSQQSQQPKASIMQGTSSPQQKSVTSLNQHGQTSRSIPKVHQQETDATGASPKKHSHRALSLKGIRERLFHRSQNHVSQSKNNPATMEGRTDRHTSANFLHTKLGTIAESNQEVGETDAEVASGASQKNTSPVKTGLLVADETEHTSEITEHEPVSEQFKERLQSTRLKAVKPTAETHVATDSALNESGTAAEQKPPVSYIAGPDSAFYFVNHQGDVFHFDPGTGDILKSGLTDVDQISLGADGHIYARSGDQMAMLDKNGMPAGIVNGETSIQSLDVPGGVQDFSVSGSKDRMYILNASGELFLKHTTPENSSSEGKAAAQTNTVALPIELMSSEPRSVASSADGSLWMMDAGGSVWHGTPEETHEHTENSQTGGELKWQKLPAASQRLTRLDTLPDGSVAGKDLDGGLHRFEGTAGWQKVSMAEVNQPTFERLHGALPKQGKGELITFLGGVATIREASSNPLKHPIDALGRVAKGIATTYRDLKHFDYSKQQQNPVVRYDAQVESFWKLLSPENMPTFDLQALGSQDNVQDFLHKVDNELGHEIQQHTKAVLDHLESELEDPKQKQAFSRPKGASQEDNVLSRLKNAREMVYGEQDELVQKLDQMISKGTFVPMDSARYRGVMASLVTDHAILVDLPHKTLNKGESLETALIDAKELRQQALPNLVAKSGIENTDPMGHAAKGFDAMQAILRQENDMLPRMMKKYAPAMGWKQDRNPTMAEASELFGRLAHTMKPGDSISLGKSTDNGFNTENFRVVVSGAFAKLTAGILAAWVVPILDVGKTKGVGLNITKTEDGLKFEMNRSDGAYGQVGARTGVGFVHTPEIIPKEHGGTWLFNGWEIAAKGKKTDTVNDSIAFTIKDDGKGNLNRVLGDVISGQADLFDLMRQSEEVNSAHGQGRNWNLGIGNVLVGAGGTEQPGWGALNAPKIPGTVGKVLGAVVPELALDFGSKSSETTSTSSSGQKTVNTTHQGFGLQGVRGNLIGVGVLESDYLKVPLPGDMMLGSDEGSPGLTGRMGIPSFLPGAILGKSFDRLAPTSKSVTVTTTSAGEPENIEVSLSINRTSKLLKKLDKDGTLQQQIPGLKPAMDQLMAQQGKSGLNFNRPVSVSMELKPEVRARIEAETPQGGKERLEALKSAAKDLHNFRLKGMDVSHGNEAKKASSLVIPARTRAVSASMSATTPFANVQMIYDRDSIVAHGESLIQSIGSYDDGAWGTSARKSRLTRLVSQLDNMVDALGKEPQVWERGDSLKQDYQSERNQLKDTFTQKVRTLMTDTTTPEQVKSVIDDFRELSVQLDGLKARYGIESHQSPGVKTSGPLFDKPDVGKLNHLDQGLQPKDDMLWTKAITVIDELAAMDLSSVKAKKLGKKTSVAQDKVDQVKRYVNAVADAKPDFKQDLFARLDLLAARPTSRALLADVKRMLVKMNTPE
ncbi:hypothetical protein [Vibrio mangrovi]|uniref:Uncharacterized protein n=1 Tax=Vibrio mangrovi TaxID=474394 RepID=A0A1Y6IVT7_9VIBR|nr:hypothetical protein [Vibrio mangrovi]MDW6004640.1 hypothetical protein [Vibrio mangrovi]SMS00930.1 hypothetical protein VIM7927_02203 [Vibrio mangrovi]